MRKSCLVELGQKHCRQRCSQCLQLRIADHPSVCCGINLAKSVSVCKELDRQTTVFAEVGFQLQDSL